MKNKKVYCKICEYLDTNNGKYICTHKTNHYENWFSLYGMRIPPEILNSNNRCENFKSIYIKNEES